MYRMAICEDNQADVIYLRSLLEKWAENSESALKIESYPSAEAFLFQYEEDKSFDLLLLDIEMGGMSGVELARNIRRENRSVQIIFITGYMEYIAEGYDVEALHYLLKPVTAEKLYRVLDRAAERLKSKEKELCLALPGTVVRIAFCEIRYLEVQRNYVTVHGKEDLTVKKTLNELEEELAIEACMALPEEERMIRVYMEMKNTQLYLSFTNSTALKKQKKTAGRFASTKGPGHGYGLVRIDAIIDRYQGYISRNSEDGAFTTEILLPQ